MSDASALKSALQLLHMPSHARVLRSRPLPPGVPLLLRIAANDAQAIREATAACERDVDTVSRAAGFFIEQILWHPASDSYRVLGASPGASAADLKRNLTLLMSWLHPDVDPRNERAVFVARVTAAWNDLKTPDRREAYAGTLVNPPRKSKSRDLARRRPSRSLSSALPQPYHRPPPPGMLGRLLDFFLRPRDR